MFPIFSQTKNDILGKHQKNTKESKTSSYDNRSEIFEFMLLTDSSFGKVTFYQRDRCCRSGAYKFRFSRSITSWSDPFETSHGHRQWCDDIRQSVF